MKYIQQALEKYWGYNEFLPFQKEAMESLRRGRDCVVVLPTGGGKSLCYQAPVMASEGMAVVVSPLISLMKDQVDALIQCGVDAMRLDSSMSGVEQTETIDSIGQGLVKLLYLSPERLLTDGMLNLLRNTKLAYFAIDEAHCVSMWGHDFRPEYRQLGRLREMFPKVTIAAYTATATEQVRGDIARQLSLNDPAMLVGSFDRPNLSYKVQPKKNIVTQVCSVLDRYKGESGIIYCIRRKDVNELCSDLQGRGYKVAPYHAGMNAEERKRNQDRFINDEVDTIVATIAFGMGIDKSNVRTVIHTGMPKSLENYQQESGRAGRDRLNAECCLFYSGADYGIWKFLMRDMPAEAQDVAMDKLNGMYGFCTSALCRHETILDYFGQTLGKDNCTACDICLGEVDMIEDTLVVAQKILSCVVRLEQRFGSSYTALVLVGSKDKRVLENRHNKLSTYALLEDSPKSVVQGWIEQLVGQGYLEKYGEYNQLSVTEKGRTVLKGQATPRLLKPAEKKTTRVSKPTTESWEGVDAGLFEELRKFRKQEARERGVPPFVVFGDVTLRDLAKQRPSMPKGLMNIKGIGTKKHQQYGRPVLTIIGKYCEKHLLEMDVSDETTTASFATQQKRRPSQSIAKDRAFELFAKQRPIREIAATINRAESTTVQYLVEFIQQENISDSSIWVDEKTTGKIRQAIRKIGSKQLKLIFDHLNGQVDYTQIKITLACLRNP
ncbi:MAG: DNA helicase RecQ [Planctomycetota bacterium]|nr:MAG: DNA helicase RecQ [Planctomycetota bacterium]